MLKNVKFCFLYKNIKKSDILNVTQIFIINYTTETEKKLSANPTSISKMSR